MLASYFLNFKDVLLCATPRTLGESMEVAGDHTIAARGRELNLSLYLHILLKFSANPMRRLLLIIALGFLYSYLLNQFKE